MRVPTAKKSASACVAAALAAAILIGTTGCSARQPVVTRDDTAITNDVRARMAANTELSALGITVATKAGIVQLTGSVPTDGARNAAERVARDTPGVVSVDNDVRFGAAEVPAQTITR